jgi:hypothetical protein
MGYQNEDYSGDSKRVFPFEIISAVYIIFLLSLSAYIILPNCAA